MTALQWALLLLGLGIVVALILSSRKQKKAVERWTSGDGSRPESGRDWAMPRPDAAADNGDEGESFDEFGVGRPRRRTAPVTSPPVVQPVARPTTPPEKSGRTPPSFVRAADAMPEKVIGFYIAEHEGTSILGPKIHAALQAQGLRFGARNIYHRLEGGSVPQFSIASLTKPGHLDPADAAGFSTPGLSVFMLLPGPVHPAAAFQDMLRTARNLAAALNAQLFDTELREPLTEERARVLQLHVEEWARRRA